MSFEKIVDLARRGDFVYMDPPYYPLKKGRNFTSYTKDNFLDKEQQELANVFDKLSEKGCLCMESNSDTEFIKDLYAKHKIHFVKARRLINADSNGRGHISEVVITNY
jgi:DNA adenine methylase